MNHNLITDETKDLNNKKAMLCSEYLFEVMDFCKEYDYTIYDENQLFQIVYGIKKGIPKKELKKICAKENSGLQMHMLQRNYEPKIRRKQIVKESSLKTRIDKTEEKYKKLYQLGVSEITINFIKDRMVKYEEKQVKYEGCESRDVHEYANHKAQQKILMREKSKIKPKKVKILVKKIDEN